MIILLIVCCLLVGAAAYYLAVARMLSRMIEMQAHDRRRESRRADALLDRLLMKHGYSPTSEQAKTQNEAIINAPMLTPFEAAEVDWEKEDRARMRAMYPTMDDQEAEEIRAAARRMA